MQARVILTVNCGSSSVRLDLFEGERRIATERFDGSDPAPALERFAGEREATAVAHRVVHGGRLEHTVRIDEAIERQLEEAMKLAPLHNAPALAGIRASRRLLGPVVPQFAVLDTAFFARLPEAARTYAVPRKLSL